MMSMRGQQKEKLARSDWIPAVLVPNIVNEINAYFYLLWQLLGKHVFL